MTVFIVELTNGVYCDDTAVAGVFATQERAEAYAVERRRQMFDDIHTSWFGDGPTCEYDAATDERKGGWDSGECEACDAYATESHYANVEAHEVQS